VRGEYAKKAVLGLCSDVENKTCETMAYHFHDDRRGMQWFIGESNWDDWSLREVLARQVASDLGEPNGVLVFDPSAFPKSGKHSAGVQRQWCGRLGKIENCQVGVFLGYVSSRGHALVDCELYLPQEWTRDKARLRKARVPRNHGKFQTRHSLALQMLNRFGAVLPHQWITGDDEMGRPADFRLTLRIRGERYLFAVPCNTLVRELREVGTSSEVKTRAPWVRVDKWAANLPADAWSPVDVRDGEKGPIEVQAVKQQFETRGENASLNVVETLVVIRYVDRDSRTTKTDYLLSNSPADTSLEEFCRVAKAEHRIEECFQRGKSDVGMADYEVRSWIGWHHHQTLSMIAAWLLRKVTEQAKKKDAGHDAPTFPRLIRGDSSSAVTMRYVPQHRLANRALAGSQPTGKSLSLETT
jgi:SRSO17 transposase